MSLQDTAKNLIAKNGRAVKIQRVEYIVGDSGKPWGDSSDTTASTFYPTMGVFMNENARDLQARLSAVSRLVLTPVETDTSIVMIAAKGLAVIPSIEDKLVDGDVTWEIKQVEAVSPGAVTFYYILKVGR